MRRFLKNILRRLLGAGGYVVIDPVAYGTLENTLAEAKDTLAHTKGGVSQIQQQVGETLSHMVVLREEIAEARERLAETKGGVSQIQQQMGDTLSHVLVLRRESTDSHKRLLETRSRVSQAQSQLGETLSQVIALRRQLGNAGGDAHYDILRDPLLRIDCAGDAWPTEDREEFAHGSARTFDLAYAPPPRFTEWLVASRMFATPLVVIDVGVQGGIGPRWDHLGDFLEVHGFDALEEAIAPLDALGRPHHRYYATALGNEDGERELFVAPEPTATSFYRHDSSRYGVDEKVSRSAGTRRVPIRRLDTLSAEGTFERADFIKIDCEGFEPEILKGAQSLLQKGVLAIEIETNFNTSPVLPQSHFGAVCEQILPHGLTLFDLAIDRIPRASFAARAQSLGIAETQTVARPGTVNALFYREGAARSADELLKRVAVLEIYGMADTAYDVLMAGADLLPPGFPLQSAADLLIKSA